MKYTEHDFKNARFATHPDGRFAARVEPNDTIPWVVSIHDGECGWKRDEGMARDGWVPGLIVTETELTQATRKEGYSTVGPATRSVMAQFGLTVIPDPEPTSVERLKAMQDDWLRESRSGELFIEYLDRMGVKAPEGEK